MKNIAVVVVVLVLALNLSKAEEAQKTIWKALVACARTIKLTKENLRKVQSWNFSNADKQLQCYVKCASEKIGVVDAKGVLQEKRAIEFISLGSNLATATAKINSCKLVHSTDPCERAYEMCMCFDKK